FWHLASFAVCPRLGRSRTRARRVLAAGRVLGRRQFLLRPRIHLQRGRIGFRLGVRKDGIGRVQRAGRDLVRRRVLLCGRRGGGGFALVARHLILRHRKPDARDQRGRDQQCFRHRNLLDRPLTAFNRHSPDDQGSAWTLAFFLGRRELGGCLSTLLVGRGPRGC